MILKPMLRLVTALVVAFPFGQPAAQGSLCTSHSAVATVAGDNWGSVTNQPSTYSDGVGFSSFSTRSVSGETRGTSGGTASARACDAHAVVHLPSVPGVSPGAFGWGQGSASSSVFVPRAGTLILKGRATPALLNGEHNGVVGVQATLLLDGVEIPFESLPPCCTGTIADHLEMRVGAGTHTLEVRVRNVRMPLNPNNFPFSPDLQAFADFRIFADPLEVGTVRDVDRFGEPDAGLAGATVKLLENGSIVATATTSASGGFNFTDVDPAELYDLQLEHGDLVRTYQAITVGTLATTSLTMPVTLRQRLDAELAELENTPTLVSAYDTASARRLTQDWNVAQPELPQVHTDRNHALARLLVASEGLSGLLTETMPVATDTAKLTVDTITTMLSAKEVVDELGEEVARRGAALAGDATGTFAERQLQVALEFLFTALDGASEKLQEVLVDAVKSVLPDWALGLFEQSLKLIFGTVLEAFSSGEWSGGDARAGLLEAITTELAGQIGGRVLATGYVQQTDVDLGLAAIRARALHGGPGVVDAFTAAQTRIIDVSTSHQELVALNATLGDTAKGWSAVADLSLLIGRRPGGQLVASLGAVIKGVSAGALTGLSVANYVALFDTAFDHAPGVVSDAFAAPAPPPAAASARSATKGGAAITASYADRLAALRAAVQPGIDETSVTRAEELLQAGDALDQALQDERLRLAALAVDANAPSGFGEALARFAAAAGVLRAERVVLGGQLGGLFAPEFADPAIGMPEILAQFDAVAQAVMEVESALATTQTLDDGLQSGAALFVATHGIDSPLPQFELGPGPFALRAELINAGGQGATAVQVELQLDTEGADGVLQLLDPATRVIGDLAPGERRSVSWRANYLPRPEEALETRVVYSLAPQASGARAQSTAGVFSLSPGEDRLFRDRFE